MCTGLPWLGSMLRSAGVGRTAEVARPGKCHVGEAQRLSLPGGSVPSWEKGCGLEVEKGGFPPTGFPQRKMATPLSQLHLEDSCGALVSAEGEPTA